MIAFAEDFDGRNPLFPKRGFELTDAIEVHDTRFIPEAGYTKFSEEVPELDLHLSGILAAVTKEQILPVMGALIDVVNPGSNCLDLVVDSFTNINHTKRTSQVHEGISSERLKSLLTSYQDLLLNDGTHAYAIATHTGECEIQLDDHKLMVLYFLDPKVGKRLEETLIRSGLQEKFQLTTVLDVEHSHRTQTHLQEAFRQLESKMRMTPLRDLPGL